MVRAAGIMSQMPPLAKFLILRMHYENAFYTPNFELNDETVLYPMQTTYEANTTAFKTSRQMFQNTLEF